MKSSAAIDRAFVGATCRDRLRQVLTVIEDGGINPEAVPQLVEKSECSAGHDLHYVSLINGLIDGNAEGSLELSRAGADWLVDHGRPSPNWERSIAKGSAPLRAWQGEALRAWCAHGRHGVIEAVTGTGKSRVGVEATREALADDFSVVIAVPTVDLVDQWVKTLKQNGVPGVGALGDGRRASFATHRVVVGTVQSLYLNPPMRPDGKVLVVADECHRYGAGQWRRLLHHSYRRRLGLTATFERNDDGIKDLLSYFGGGPVFTIGFDRAIADGVVAHYDVKLLGVPLTHAERNEYDEADRILKDARLQLLAADFPAEPFGAFLHEVVKAAEDDYDPTVSDIARRFLKAFSKRIDVMTCAQEKIAVTRRLGPEVNRSGGAIIFTRRVAMAEEIAATLVESGVRAEPIHSDLTRSQRHSRLAALKSGRLKALVAPTILDEGIDVPDIDLGIVMGGSRSRRQMIQRMGRVLRLKSDGRKATFIVVYAEDTTEDLTRTDGAEGCLDLIVQSADSVQRLERVSPLPVETPECGSIGTTHADPAASTRNVSLLSTDNTDTPVVGGTIALAPESNRPPASGRDSEDEADQARKISSALDPARLPMTRVVLRAYAHAHGVEEVDADPALRNLLTDFLHSAKITLWPHEPNAIALRRSGLEVIVNPERFLRYRSRRLDAHTWADVRDGSHQEQPSTPQHNDGPVADDAWSQHPAFSQSEVARDPHVVDRSFQRGGSARRMQRAEDTHHLLESLEPAYVAIDSRVVICARKKLGFGAVSFEQAEDRVRTLLAADIAENPDVRTAGRTYAIFGNAATWTVRNDGLVVHTMEPKLRDAVPATDRTAADIDVKPATPRTAVPRPNSAIPTKKKTNRSVSAKDFFDQDPALLLDFLDPTTIGVDMAAVTHACDVFRLGDPLTEEALIATRTILTEDLQERPDITSVFGRFTIHGRRATWTLRGDGLGVVALEARRGGRSHTGHDSRRKDGPPVAEQETASDPARAVRAASVRAADTMNPAQSRDAKCDSIVAPTPAAHADPEPERPAAAEGDLVPTGDNALVEQIERLAVLKHVGLLTDEEFTAAKAKILF